MWQVLLIIFSNSHFHPLSLGHFFEAKHLFPIIFDIELHELFVYFRD